MRIIYLFTILLIIYIFSFPSYALAKSSYSNRWDDVFESYEDVRFYYNSTNKADAPPFHSDIQIGLEPFATQVYSNAISDDFRKVLLDQPSPTDLGFTKNEVISGWLQLCYSAQKTLDTWGEALKKIKEYTDERVIIDPDYLDSNEFESLFVNKSPVYVAIKEQYAYVVGRGPSAEGYSVLQPCLVATADVLVGSDFLPDSGDLVPYHGGVINPSKLSDSGCFYIGKCQPATKLTWIGRPDEETVKFFAVSDAASKDLLNTYTKKLADLKEIGAEARAKAAEKNARAIAATKQGSVLSLSLPLGDTSPAELIGRLIKQILGIVGALALGFFIYGGFTYLTAAGNQERITKAKGVLVWATLGLVIIFTSYAIVDFIIEALK